MRVDYLPEAYNHGEPAGTPRFLPSAFTPLVSGFSLVGFKSNTVASNKPILVNIATSDERRAAKRCGCASCDHHHCRDPPVADLLKASDTLQFSFKGKTTPVGQVNFDLTDGHQLINDYIAACH